MSDTGARRAIGKMVPGSRTGGYPAAQPVDPTKPAYSIQRPATPGGCYALIDEVISDGTYTDMWVEGITDGFADLRVEVAGTVDTHSGGTDNLGLYFNDDYGGSYDSAAFLMQNSITEAGELSIQTLENDNSGIVFAFTQFSGFDRPDAPGWGEMWIPSYTAAGFRRIANGTGGGVLANGDGSAFGFYQMMTNGVWKSTDPVTKVLVSAYSDTFTAGTRLAVYGRC